MNKSTNSKRLTKYKKYGNSIDEISSNCYNNESIKQGHYLNTDISPFIWEKCHERCEKCIEGSNITNMNCLSCKSNLINTKTNKSYFFIKYLITLPPLNNLTHFLFDFRFSNSTNNSLIKIKYK